MKKTDTQLVDEVLDELERDTLVRETDVSVDVDAGTVTLTGTVDSGAARLAAEEAAFRIAGVIGVLNELRVQEAGQETRTDAEITQAVPRALARVLLGSSDQIQANVTNGVVTLTGRVDLWREYDDAARAARGLPGVRDVRNQIRVEPELQGMSPRVVRSAIETALERYADHVEIAVTNGKVTLSGAVTSAADLRRVEGAVRQTPGVRQVDNHLRVSS